MAARTSPSRPLELPSQEKLARTSSTSVGFDARFAVGFCFTDQQREWVLYAVCGHPTSTACEAIQHLGHRAGECLFGVECTRSPYWKAAAGGSILFSDSSRPYSGPNWLNPTGRNGRPAVSGQTPGATASL